MATKILLVEDDENLGFVTQDSLEQAGFKVTWKKDGQQGFDEFCKSDFDICLLDVMLPVKDGFQLGVEIREINSQIPIVFLTAKSLDQDKIRGFQIGADDYVTKPFNIDLLILRIQALIKRSTPFAGNQEELFQIGKLQFNYSEQIVFNDHQKEKLSNKEAEIFRLLCLNKNAVLSREVALKVIWGENDYFKGRSMDVFIARLRKVIKMDESLEILNVHGKGFQLKEGNS
jgi:two-component system OmpR family response regulator